MIGSRMVQDPEDATRWVIGSAAEETFGAQVGSAVLVNVHPESACANRGCPVHHPSNHKMRDWPLNWRGDRGLMERLCVHGIGHPDPDDIAFKKSIGRYGHDVHGCCGCCAG